MCPQKWRLHVLVFEDLFFFFHALQDVDEFRDLRLKLRVLKIDSLSSDTPSSPSSFMTWPSFQGSIAHNVKSTFITWHLCCCTLQVPKLLPNPGRRAWKKSPQKQGQPSFWRTQLFAFMRIISVCADDLCLQTSASTVDLVDSAVDRHKSF